MKTLLAVIDMQNGFVNRASRHIIKGVTALIRAAQIHQTDIAFTRFINQPRSGYEKWLRWSKMRARDEIAIIAELQGFAKRVFDKPGYTAFVPAFCSFVRSRGIKRILFCGMDTDCCVLTSAVDAFERDIEPFVVHDASASRGGVKAHDAAKLILRRLVGRAHLISTHQAIRRLSETR